MRKRCDVCGVYDHPDLTTEELHMTSEACGPEMELYKFAMRLHQRQLK